MNNIDWSKKLVALRSLRSIHHATNIEPQIINVTWFTGKRCNYNCSYCSPAIHDWVSPHCPVPDVKSLFSQINRWAISQNKTFTITLTGGEPFVHPNIIEILSIIRETQSWQEQLTVTSNGSVPLELYQQAFEYMTHLTISLHLERSDSETENTLQKIIALNQQFPDKWINVQVMCLPGKLDYVENTVMPLLESNNVKFTLRRIRPWLNEIVDEWKHLSKKEIMKKVYSIEDQSDQRHEEKINQDHRLMQVYAEGEFYSPDELEWFRTHEPATAWQNIALWNEDLDYFETNGDRMVVNDRNQFRGWSCFAGIDSLYIDFDGQVYRGNCQNAGALGRMGGDIDFPDGPTTCERQVCISVIDHTIRKAHPDYVHLVTKQSVDS